MVRTCAHVRYACTWVHVPVCVSMCGGQVLLLCLFSIIMPLHVLRQSLTNLTQWLTRLDSQCALRSCGLCLPSARIRGLGRYTQLFLIRALGSELRSFLKLSWQALYRAISPVLHFDDGWLPIVSSPSLQFIVKTAARGIPFTHKPHLITPHHAQTPQHREH